MLFFLSSYMSLPPRWMWDTILILLSTLISPFYNSHVYKGTSYWKHRETFILANLNMAKERFFLFPILLFTHTYMYAYMHIYMGCSCERTFFHSERTIQIVANYTLVLLKTKPLRDNDFCGVVYSASYNCI